MDLTRKKILAAKTLGIGKNRIYFNQKNLAEIKEAITRQDIKTLYQEGIITIKAIHGRRKIRRRKTKRSFGKIKKRINKRKQEYVKLTRKLRRYLIDLKSRGIVDKELYWKLRKKIKMREFKSKAGFKEHLNSLGVKFDEIKYKIEEEKSRKKINKKPKELKENRKK